MLLSGTDNHIAGLGTMAEVKGEYPPGIFENRPGYEGYLNFRVAALPELLQDGGYQTLMAGKWHLGMKPELAPAARGFDRSFVLLPGAGNHYGWAPNLDPETKKHCPPFIDGNNLYMEDGEYFDHKTDLPEDFFSTRTFTEKMLGYLDEWDKGRKDSTGTSKPFFGYMAYTAPHWPLQAKPETIKSYSGFYDKGPEDLRLKRLDALTKAGLVPEGVEPHPMVANTPEWQELNDQQKKVAARKMEIYASMVEEMDTEIGRLADKLEAIGELDNTFIVFMSDNGAEGSLMEAKPVAGSNMDRLARLIEDNFDRSFNTMGKKESFVVYGPRWALAATAPSKGFKGMTSEGGIRCPCIVRYPALTRSSKGEISHDFMNVMDVCPTLLELAGLKHPGSTFRGREVAKIRGKSWVPYLKGAKDDVYDAELDVTGWELFGQNGIRRGDYKALLHPPPRGTGEWELFNVKTDPGELHDLSKKEPAIMADLMEEWNIYYAETGMFDLGPRKW